MPASSRSTRSGVDFSEEKRESKNVLLRAIFLRKFVRYIGFLRQSDWQQKAWKCNTVWSRMYLFGRQFRVWDENATEMRKGQGRFS